MFFVIAPVHNHSRYVEFGAFSALRSPLVREVLMVDDASATSWSRRAWAPRFSSSGSLRTHELAGRHDLLPLLANQNFIATTSSMVFTKELYERVGGFRDLHYVHDWDFALRAAAVGRCEYVPQFLSLYRSHSHNAIKTHEAAIRAEVVRLFRDFERDFGMACNRPEVALAMAGNRYLRAGSGKRTLGQISRKIGVARRQASR